MSGCEWIIEAHGCDAEALADVRKLQGLFSRLIEDLDLRPVAEPAWHKFPGPGGVTGVSLLAESHLTCHTFPEYNSLCLNLFCCRPRPQWDFEGCLRADFSAQSVRVRRIDRPYREIASPAAASD